MMKDAYDNEMLVMDNEDSDADVRMLLKTNDC